MTNRNNYQVKPWLLPMITLIKQKNFGEAFELGKFLPETKERLLLQCVALIYRNKFKECERILKDLNTNAQQAAQFLSPFLDKEQENIHKAFREQCFNTACTLIEISIIKYPGSVSGLELRKSIEEVKRFNLNSKGETTTRGIEEMQSFEIEKDSSQEIEKNDDEPFNIKDTKNGSTKIPIYEFIDDIEVFEIEIPITKESKGAHGEQLSTIERYTRIQFPTECKLNKSVDLKIQLMRDIPSITRFLEKISLTTDKNEKELVLDVHVTSPGFEKYRSSQIMKVPVNADSDELIFQLTPIVIGFHSLEIEFFFKSSRVGYIILKTKITEYPKNIEDTAIFSMEDPVESLKHIESIDPKRRRLSVNWDQLKGIMYFTVDSGNGCIEDQQMIPKSENAIEKHLRDLNAFLLEIASISAQTQEDWDSMVLTMTGFGTQLFEKILPLKVVECVKKWENGSTVIISTDEQWIPWELMHDGDDFWGKKFVIARCPRQPYQQKNFPIESRNVQTSSNELNGIVNVIGGNLPADEITNVEKLFEPFSLKVPVEILKEKPISNLKTSLNHANAVHFTCHGHLSPPMLQIARDKTQFRNLRIDSVSVLSLPVGCFVFANACSSGATVINFGDFCNFGWEFYKAGAGVFIGTLGAVPATYAIQFAKSVYTELFNAESSTRTIGQAIVKAKKEAEKKRNLFWLLYTIYGNPDASLDTGTINP